MKPMSPRGRRQKELLSPRIALQPEPLGTRRVRLRRKRVASPPFLTYAHSSRDPGALGQSKYSGPAVRPPSPSRSNRRRTTFTRAARSSGFLWVAAGLSVGLQASSFQSTETVIFAQAKARSKSALPHDMAARSDEAGNRPTVLVNSS